MAKYIIRAGGYQVSNWYDVQLYDAAALDLCAISRVLDATRHDDKEATARTEVADN